MAGHNPVTIGCEVDVPLEEQLLTIGGGCIECRREVEGTYSCRGSDALPPGEPSGYHNVADSQGNVWVATYRGSGGIIGVDIKTNEVKWVPVPPRRMDAPSDAWTSTQRRHQPGQH